MRKKEKILFAATECTPFFSTGGLGDVIGSLPQAIKNLKKTVIDIRVILPLHSLIKTEYKDSLKKLLSTTCLLSWRSVQYSIYSLKKDGVVYYFIENGYYYDRPSLYGEYDDGERYAFFCKAVIDAMEKLDFYPDVFHAHDWQTALSVVYLKSKYKDDPRYSSIKTVFTIHNIAFQGIYDMGILGDVFELGWEDQSIVEYSGCINLMKGAIQVCDLLSTVSPTYAEEIKTPEYAFGLEHIINLNSYKLVGILNGIDYTEYDPADEACIKYPFNSENIENKKACKAAFKELAGLDASADSPIFSVVSRLTSQKGIDLILSKLAQIINLGNHVVILGTGDKMFEEALEAVEPYYRGKLKVFLKFDKELAKQIYACSDFFLMPSKTEPCGLAQMIALRYGTVPIVRETGGLYDSVKDFGCGESGCGFTFREYSGDDLYWSVMRADDLYQNKDEFNEFIKKIMKIDYSWTSSAKVYYNEYKRLLAN